MQNEGRSRLLTRHGGEGSGGPVLKSESVVSMQMSGYNDPMMFAYGRGCQYEKQNVLEVCKGSTISGGWMPTNGQDSQKASVCGMRAQKGKKCWMSTWDNI